ncbi:MAG: EAL domain-containing protein [Actinobacteria bacterium]|nr:EAL domain-containing protein [Actinomycetota bacterium]
MFAVRSHATHPPQRPDDLVEVVEREGSVQLPTLPGDFNVHYQPALDLRDGSMHTADAVLRWWHPVFGVLRPGPSLKGTGWAAEVQALETWTIHEVCRQAAAWVEAHPGLELTVNPSPTRLLAPEFASTLTEALAAHDLDPCHVAVAVPLGAVAVDPVALTRTMARISRLGARVLLDGVGAGSTLSVIGELDAPIWRIDVRPARRRERGLHPTAVEALERARDLGATTVAASVDDAATLTEAIDIGFDRAAGRVISPPVTALAVQSLLRRRPVRRRASLFGPSGSASARAGR